MATKEKWITDHEAAAILSSNTDHEVKVAYVRTLARLGHIRSIPLDGRTNGYSLRDVAAYRVRPKHTPRVRPVSERKTYRGEKQEESQETAA